MDIFAPTSHWSLFSKMRWEYQLRKLAVPPVPAFPTVFEGPSFNGVEKKKLFASSCGCDVKRIWDWGKRVRKKYKNRWDSDLWLCPIKDRMGFFILFCKMCQNSKISHFKFFLVLLFVLLALLLLATKKYFFCYCLTLLLIDCSNEKKSMFYKIRSFYLIEISSKKKCKCYSQ